MTRLTVLDKKVANLEKEIKRIAPLQQVICNWCRKSVQIRSVDTITRHLYEDRGSPNGAELCFIHAYFICTRCGRENTENTNNKFQKLFRRFRKHFKSVADEHEQSF